MKKLTLFISFFLLSSVAFAGRGPVCNPSTAAFLLRATSPLTFTQINYIAGTRIAGTVTFFPGRDACTGTYTASAAAFLGATAAVAGSYEVGFTVEFMTPSRGMKRFMSLITYTAAGAQSHMVFPDSDGNPLIFNMTDIYELTQK